MDNGWFEHLSRKVGWSSIFSQIKNMVVKISGNGCLEIGCNGAEERLPIIATRAGLKEATVHLRSIPSKNRSYFDVYLPSAIGQIGTTRRLLF